MSEWNGNNRSEIAKAESTLQSLEADLQQIRSMLAERKSEKRSIEAQPQELMATGDINRLMSLKRHSIGLDKVIAELTTSEKECAARVESARRYLYTLYIRLERLRQEASTITKRMLKVDKPQAVSPEDQTALRRVNVQIEAIAGAEEVAPM